MSDQSPKKDRSRSPPRGPKASRGFKWKDHSRSNDSNYDRRDNDRRDHDRRRDRYQRSRSPRGRRDYDGPGDRYSDRNRDRLRSPRRDEPAKRDRDGEEKKSKKDKKPAKPAPGPQQEMIIVHVNDRLGTKTAVPCLPSDTVGELKLMIAARIGRDAGQIMLRRQGERPFKDQITLEDYAISNGVQLDLEIDTGD